jgi:anti-sigma regulatory factor (Ser/Thr protein kinase)
MTLNREHRQEIKKFILRNLRQHPKDIVKTTQEKFGLSRTAINKYMHELAEGKLLSIQGSPTRPEYILKPISKFSKTYSMASPLEEDKVWRQDIVGLFAGVPKNVLAICQYGFTEMFNNAIDHSEGSEIFVQVMIWIDLIEITILDNGVGIFNKIQQKFKLDDPRQAILELSKGKLTTDPSRHSGEGIFFTSRMFDSFYIVSGRLIFGHKNLDILIENEENKQGSNISMRLFPFSDKTTESIFNEFTDDDQNFNKTMVPVLLSRYGDENLISRSQAKRLLARFEKFKIVVLDFSQIDTIGRAFADEIFRVYQNAHPDINLAYAGASESITKLIAEIQSNQS